MSVKVVETALRDGHQSLIATRLTTDEIVGIVEEMDKVGYYALEVWGGATFDSCLRFLNEDPWERLREIKKRVKNTKLQMLLRGQNLLGYRHYSDDVVEKFIEKAVENGIDIFRVFDALNDYRNIDTCLKAIKKYGAHCQLAMSYTTSPVHTIEYYVQLAKEYEGYGADSICIKDMSGILLPQQAYDLISQIKKEVSIPINLHIHATSGIAEMTIQKAIEAGVDIVDTAISPLSSGTSHMATESLYYSYKGLENDLKFDETSLNNVTEYFINIRNKYLDNGILNPMALTINPQILTYQVPGGMLSNLMSQLKEQGALDKYEEILKEIPRVKKDMGYPPLVTPMSQMVGTQATMNILAGERYKLISKEIKDYVKGLYGKSPMPIDQEIITKIIGDAPIITHRPADDLMPQFEEAKIEAASFAFSDEDVLSYLLFPQVAKQFLENKGKKHEPQETEVFEINLVI